MSIQSKIPCWEIIQCNNKQICLSAETDTKACWEMIEEVDGSSFHNCLDCLVYLAKHKSSILTEEEFCSILEKRKNHSHKVAYAWNRSPAFVGSTVRIKSILAKHPLIRHGELSP